MRIVCILMMAALPVFSQPVALENGAMDETFPLQRGSGEILFSTFPGRALPAWTVPCQQFTDAVLEGFTVYVADDFQIWNLSTINKVEVFGTYFNGAGPADSINIYIFADDAIENMPDTLDPEMAVYSAEALPYVDRNFGDFTVDLPGAGAILPPGRYWLCVQPIMAAGVGGQWGWTESSDIADTGQIYGFESTLYQTQNILPPGSCVNDWGRRISTCGFTRPNVQACEEFDMAFSLEGSDIDLITATPGDSLTTSEMGPAAFVDVVLATAPSDPVTIDVYSSDPTEAQVSAMGVGNGLGASLVFTPENWNQPQTLKVQGVNDRLADGDAIYRVVFDPAVSSDVNFSGFKLRNIEGLNQEDACVSNQLTDPTVSTSSNPSFSADALLLAFQSNGDFVGSNGDGNTEIFVYSRNTDDYTQITDTPSGDSQWPSLDGAGEWLAMSSTAGLTGGTRGAVPEIYLYDVNGAQFTKITDSTGSPSGSLAPAISVDGGSVVFISDADHTGGNPDGSLEAFLYNGVSITQISGSGSGNVGAVAINGDGTRVVYTRLDTERPLFSYDVTEGAATQIASGFTSYPAISHDGDRVSFVSTSDYTGGNPGMTHQVFLYDFLPTNGTPFTQLTSGDSVLRATMNAEGTRVAFVATDDLTGDNPSNFPTLFSLDVARDVLTQVVRHYGLGIYSNNSYRNGYIAYGADMGCYTTGAGTLGYAWLPAFEDQLSQWPDPLTVADFLDDICD